MMNLLKSTALRIAFLFLIGSANLANAADAYSVVGVGGYDLVSYHTGKKPLPGNGNHVVKHNGVNYLFSSADNAKQFSKNKEKYLPAYGGYCAYGVAVGKKFIADPTVWEVVKGKLYLNLDNSIKSSWAKDIPGNIQSADEEWPSIKDTPAEEL